MPVTSPPTVPFTLLASGSLTSAIPSTVLFTVQHNDFIFGIGGTFVATVQIERNRANVGGTLGWIAVSADPTQQGGGYAIYTAPVEVDVFEPIIGTQYRLNCTAFTSGTINFEIWG